VEATANSAGQFTFATTFVGTCDVYAKVNHWLNKKVGTLTLAGNGSYSLNAHLPTGGDCDNSNVVDLTDYTIVALAFNALPVSANWNPDADLNEDGVVDLTDYTIVAINFNAVGE
jgi:large repetitive protein